MEGFFPTFFNINDMPEISRSVLWETFKAVARGHIISYSAKISKQEKSEMKSLAEAILKVDRAHSQTLSTELFNERSRLQSKFDLISIS